jgi:hypothetical protein
MSTSYYLRKPCPNPCAHCDLGEIHLGLSASGWVFQFAANDAATDYASWLKQLVEGEIFNEYGDPIKRENLLELIEKKRGGRQELSRDDYLDADGRWFIKEYFG